MTSPNTLLLNFVQVVRYYQGNRSPIDYEKEVKGYSLGWLHHKGRNKHHWEYWLDNAVGGIKPVKMTASLSCGKCTAIVLPLPAFI